jgi:hypothetical protein
MSAPFAFHRIDLRERTTCDRILVTTSNANVAQIFRQPSSFASATPPYRIRNRFGAGIWSVVMRRESCDRFDHALVEGVSTKNTNAVESKLKES